MNRIAAFILMSLCLCAGLFVGRTVADSTRQVCLTGQELRSIQDALCFSDQTSWYMYHLFVQDECACPGGLSVEQMGYMQEAIEVQNATVRGYLGLLPCEK